MYFYLKNLPTIFYPNTILFESNEHTNNQDVEDIINIYKKFLIIISAFIPYIANECWENITGKPDLTFQEWPKIDETFLNKENFDIVIQINGKKRAIINAINN